ncbi:MAG: hypothetical protein WC547_05340 [Candidatus Omnitrophota bacterium]
MITNKVIGLLLLVFAVYTIIGMAAANAAYWQIYNYVTLLLSVTCGIVLLRMKA